MTDLLKSKEENKVRKRWIDLTRGFGIFTVVLVHCINGSYTTLVAIMDIFNMPIFFYLTGYLYKSEPNIFKNFYERVLRFLVPFAAMATTIVVVAVILRLISVEDAIGGAKSMLWGGVFWIHNYNRYLGPMWFLGCIFLTQNAYNLFNQFVPRWGMHIVSLLMLCGAYFYQINYREVPIPWFANIAMFAFPFFHIGYMARTTNFRIPTVLLYVLGVAAILSIFWLPMNRTMLVISYFGIPGITFLSSVFSSLMIIDIFKRVESKHNLINTFFETIGKASLTILGFHVAIFYMSVNLGFPTFIESQFLYITFFVVITIIISYLLYLCFNKTKITRFLFLGEYKVFKKQKI